MVSGASGSSKRESPAASLPTILIVAVAAAVTVLGWKLFWFLTDDAYIAFRYVSNSMAGRGLVWNPAPFQPVEGYTSFLWVVLLRLVWGVTGAEPPQAANVLSLLFGLATLGLGVAFIQRMSLPPRVAPWRPVLLALALLGVVTNRTYLAWLSSGLETALFNFLFTWWVYEGTAAAGRDRPAFVARLTLAAALTALCRPDGLLIVAATVFILVIENRSIGSRLLAAAPLLLVPAHVLWRWHTYGDWLPNTYRAKYSGAWPESGLRYFACFVLEYGIWWWAALLILWRSRLAARAPVNRTNIARATAIAVVVTHFAYYTLVIGGDLFEYRVYSHLILLMFVSAAWLAAQLADRGVMAAALLAGFVLVSYPIPWTHWWASRSVKVQKDEFLTLVQPVAPYFPWPLRPVVAQWDEWQEWLIRHFVCRRQEEQKAFEEELVRRLPSRQEGLAMSWDDRGVLNGASVGVPGWVFPNVAVIDWYGLNDRVIARQGPHAPSGETRRMAHDRAPPPGYVDCFRPNVHVKEGRVVVEKRDRPLTDEDIRACESRDWRRGGPPVAQGRSP
jgi:arabinofuranosyltransferase